MVLWMGIAPPDAVAGHVYLIRCCPRTTSSGKPPVNSARGKNQMQQSAVTFEVVWGHNGWEGRGMLPGDWKARIACSPHRFPSCFLLRNPLPRIPSDMSVSEWNHREYSIALTRDPVPGRYS